MQSLVYGCEWSDGVCCCYMVNVNHKQTRIQHFQNEVPFCIYSYLTGHSHMLIPEHSKTLRSTHIEREREWDEKRQHIYGWKMSSSKKSKLVLKSKHKKDIFLGTRTHHHCRLQRHICFVRTNKIKRNNDEGFIVWRFEKLSKRARQ